MIFSFNLLCAICNMFILNTTTPCRVVGGLTTCPVVYEGVSPASTTITAHSVPPTDHWTSRPLPRPRPATSAPPLLTIAGSSVRSVRCAAGPSFCLNCLDCPQVGLHRVCVQQRADAGQVECPACGGVDHFAPEMKFCGIWFRKSTE